MAGVNKVILVGNLGNDPDIRYAASGMAIANISLATSDSWKDKNTGEMQEKTEWHRVVFFNRLAEIVGQYLHKGSQIYVEGRLQTKKWTDKSGMDRYTTEVVAGEMKMLGRRQDGGVSTNREPTPSDPSFDQSPSQSSQAPATPDAAQPPSDTDFDDDIPF